MSAIPAKQQGSTTGNPWLDNFGWAANDPQFDDFQEELQRARAADVQE